MAISRSTPGLTINPAEKFEHLPNAPIVEAAIEFRARAESPWEEREVVSALQAALPEYSAPTPIREFSFMVALGVAPTGAQSGPAAPSGQDQRWLGARLESQQGLQIAMFTRDSFRFSRLKPYEDWRGFCGEALRLWRIHTSIARVSEVQRLGVRFINRLTVPAVGLDFSDYFKGLGTVPEKLTSAGFLYRDVLSIPGYSYRVNLTRTFQPPEADPPATVALLVDIDVFCPEPFEPDAGKIDARLADMHWLKNYVFFGSLTDRALDLCR